MNTKFYLTVFLLLGLTLFGMGSQAQADLPDCDVANPDAVIPAYAPAMYDYYNHATYGARDLFTTLFQKQCVTPPATTPEQATNTLKAWNDLRVAGNSMINQVDQTQAAQTCANLVNTLNSPSKNCLTSIETKIAPVETSVASVEGVSVDPALDADLKACKIHRETSLPGSGQFASDFIENISRDPANPNHAYAITADISSGVSPKAMYISQSNDGGKTWQKVAKMDPSYFDVYSDGMRNQISVSSGGKDVVVTTSKGTFSLNSAANGAGVFSKLPEPEGSQAKSVKITPDGKNMVVTYAYLDYAKKKSHALQTVTYHRDSAGQEWSKTELPDFSAKANGSQLPLSVYIDPNNSKSVYLGTGDDGVYHYDAVSNDWKRVPGIPGDAAVHDMELDQNGKLYAMTCQGAFTSTDTIVDALTAAKRVGSAAAAFMKKIESGDVFLVRGHKTPSSTIRAYSVDFNPADKNQMAMTTDSGVFISQDGGKDWKLFKQTSAKTTEEFRTVHFAADGALLFSGAGGTYVANPFAKACATK